jgi:hypothetical protein
MAPKQFLSAFSLLASLALAQTPITLEPAILPSEVAQLPPPLTTFTGSTSIISYYMDIGYPQDLIGSIITANPTMTAIFFEGNPILPDGLSGNLTIQNDNTYIVTMTVGDEASVSVECTAYATDSVVCSYSTGGLEANPTAPPTGVDTNIAGLMSITVTAGLENLVSATAMASTAESTGASAGGSKTTSAKKTGSTSSTATGSAPISNAGRMEVWPAIALLSIIAIIMNL